MDSYFSIAIRQDQQDHQDKENLAQKLKAQGERVSPGEGGQSVLSSLILSE
jgi:hypothetical protein